MTAIPPALALLASLTFALLYARAQWHMSETGRNLMSMAACLVILSGGSLIYRLSSLDWGKVLLDVGWLLVAAVMLWRTCEMWRANHPDKEG